MSQWRHHDQKDAFLGEKESTANERQAKSAVDLTGILVCSEEVLLGEASREDELKQSSQFQNEDHVLVIDSS